jgi:glucose dehydrogenase
MENWCGRFTQVPRPGEFGYDTWPKDAWKYIGGVNNWGEMTIDARRGIAYITLGSPTYDFYGADRQGANLFGTSIVALDARTGKRKWHFQLVHHDLWDMDPQRAPQLTTIRQNGRNREVVVVSSKLTWLYVLDRDTGESIWPSRGTSCSQVGNAGRSELAHTALPDQSSSDIRGSRSLLMMSVRIWRPTKRKHSRSVWQQPPTWAFSLPLASTTQCIFQPVTAAYFLRCG